MKSILAIENLEIGASRDDIKSLRSLATCYEEQQQLEKAEECLHKAEDLGDVDVLISLTNFYYDHHEIYSWDNALKYAKKALDHGNKPYNLLGCIYAEKFDFDSAYYWWQKGFEEDVNTEKCYANMGWMYYNGMGVDYSEENAYKSFSHALELEPNDSYVLYHLGLMYHYGQYVAKDDSIALSYLKKAADLGDEDAQKVYGEIMKNRKTLGIIR